MRIADPRLLHYARAHRLTGVAAAMTSMALLMGLWGTLEVDVPVGSGRGAASIPLWVLLPLVMAAVIVVGTSGEMTQFEQVAARSLWRYELTYIAMALITAALMTGFALRLSGRQGVLLGAERNLLFWTGIAVLSGRLFGRSLSWVGPLAAAGPLIWFGYQDEGPPRWWAVPLQAPNGTSWLVAVVVFALAAGQLPLSAWHLRRVRLGRRLPLPAASGDQLARRH